MLQKNRKRKGNIKLKLLLLVLLFISFISNVKAANEYELRMHYNGTYDIPANERLDTSDKMNYTRPFTIWLDYSRNTVASSGNRSILGDGYIELYDVDSTYPSYDYFVRLKVGSTVYTCKSTSNNQERALYYNSKYQIKLEYIADSDVSGQSVIRWRIDNVDGVQQCYTAFYFSSNTSYSGYLYLNGTPSATSAYALNNVQYSVYKTYNANEYASVSNIQPYFSQFSGYIRSWGYTSTSTYSSRIISSVKMTSNTSIYLIKTPKYIVTLDSQNATTDPSPTTIYYIYGVNGYYSRPSLGGFEINSITIPQKNGATFLGYYTEPGGGGTQYINSSGGFVNNLYNVSGDTTLYAYWSLSDPVAPTISGAGTMLYGNSDSQLLYCSTSSSYDSTFSGLTFYYQFGYSTTSSGTVNWIGSASTTNTLVISDTDYLAQRWYKCRMYATDGNQTTSTLTSSSAAEVTINNATVTFDATTRGGTLNGQNTLYYRSGKAGFLNGLRTSSAATPPTATKEGRTFVGWYKDYTQLTDGNNNIIANVSGWTDANGKWTKSANMTLTAHYGLVAPATPTISGGGSVVRGSSSNMTVTCNTQNPYPDSNIVLAYQIGYSTTDGGTSITWVSGENSNPTFSISTTGAMRRWYSCRAHVFENGGWDNSEYVASLPANNVLVEVRHPSLTFDAATNGGTGGAQLYAEYYQSNIFTDPVSYTATTTAPIASSNGGTFTGWWTEPTGGLKVINADGSRNVDVSGWTNSNGAFLITEDSTLYAQYSQNTYSAVLDNQGATSAGTQNVYYKYFTAGANCNYYTNANLTTCLNSITKPTKTGYVFRGYYSEENGGGTKYIDEDGTFVNDLYKKVPSDINSSYTTAVTLYAYWEQPYLIYDFQINETFGGTENKYLDTGYFVDWSKDFEIHETFRIPEAGKSYNVISNRGNGSTLRTPAISVTSENKLVLQYANAGTIWTVTHGTVTANEDINLVFKWDATTHKYNIKATGAVTNINATKTYTSFVGIMPYTLRLGQDHRSGSAFSPVEVSNLQIYEKKTTGEVVTDLLQVTSGKYILEGWYSEDTFQNKVTSVTMDEDKTLYANYRMPKLTYDYQINESFTGTTDSYFDTDYTVDFDKDFEIETTFRVSELDVRHLIVSSYNTAYSSNKFFHIDVNNNNTIRVFSGSNSAVTTSTTTISANEDIYLKYTWNASTKTFTLTATGTNTNISMTKTYSSLSGACVRTLWTGNVRGRESGYYGSTNIKSLKISNEEKHSSVITDMPHSLKNGASLGWYTEAVAGTQVIKHTMGDDATLYAHYTPIYSVVLDNQGADIDGTTKYYYSYKESRVIDGTTCYYYTDPELEECISKIDEPIKDEYAFGGYYVKENGQGMQYITSVGGFTNNIYLKTPSEIDSSYTDEITLYAAWGRKEYITYDYQNNDSFDGTLDSYFNTGYFVNFDRDFEIEETFRVSELDNHYLLIGSYNASASSSKFFQLSVNEDNTIRAYLGSATAYKDSEGTINANENINLKFSWDAATQTYMMTAKGTNTDITMTDTVEVSGKSVRELRLGSDRGRSAAYFGPISVSNLKISNDEDYGTVLTNFPSASKVGYAIGWFDQATGGNKVELITVEEDRTLYAQWLEQKELTYDYRLTGTYGTTAESYFNTGYDIDWDKDFKIEVTFNVSELDQRKLIIGNFYSTSVRKVLNIELSAANKIRVYIIGDSATSDTSSEETISANEDINLIFSWDATNEVYTLTATGTNTNISMTNAVGVGGISPRILRVGQDNRASAVFTSINISALKITSSQDINSTVSDFPTTFVDGSALAWYDQVSGGNKVTSILMNANKTIYARWIEQNSLTYDYNLDEPLEFDGTDDSYLNIGYKIDWGKNFEIDETFKIAELGKRYLIFGCYEKNSDNSNCINVEINASNKVRVFGYGVGSYAQDLSFDGTLVANEDIDFKFIWDAETQYYNITLTGTNTEFNINNSITGMIGTSARAIRLGQDYRGYSVYNPIEVSELTISEDKEVGEVVTNFPEITKDGENYDWYTARTSGEKVTSITMNADKTIYAQWINTYSITFDDINATTSGTDKIYYKYNSSKEINGVTCYYFTDSALTTCISGGAIVIPVKEHYVFEGYYTEENGEGTKYVDETGAILNNIYQKYPREINNEYDKDITLYANWIGEDITVALPDGTEETYHYGDSYTFGTNDTARADEAGSTITFKYQDNESSDTEATVTKSYTPAGWLVDETEYEDNEILILTENIEVEYNYTVTSTSPSFPEPTRTGYTFDGWYDAEENGIEVTSYTDDADINLYAYWVANEVTVTLPDGTEEIYHYGDSYTFGTNDTAKANENGATITFKYQDNETADTELNVVKSYTPNGWLVGNTEYADGAVLVLTEDIEIEYNYTETLTNPSFPEPTRTDYMFDGWYTDTNYETKVTEESVMTENVTLYAHWIEDIRENENQCIIVKPDETTLLINKGETYNLGANDIARSSEDVATVTFKYQDDETSDTTGKVTRTYTPNGWLVNDTEYVDNADYTCDTDMAVIRANYTEELVSPIFPEPTREHYSFDGWFDAEEEGLEVTEYTGSEDINLYAYWTADEVTVTLPDGTEETYYYGYSYTLGTNATPKANENVATITFKYQDGVTADTELDVVKSYTPNGWLAGVTEYEDNEVLILTEDIELEYNYIETVTNPSFPEPTRTDYMFDGWYDSTEWVNKVTEESEILDDINLYAHWIEDIRENENQCIIVKPDETTVLINKGETYNLGENDITKAAEDVSTVTFKYQDNETADTTGKVTRSYTPNAWLVNDTEYADNSDYTCDSDMAVIRANYIEELVSPVFPEPTREHYTFDGWYDSEENGLEVTTYVGLEDINLYAYWIAEVVVTLPDGTEETYHYGDSYTFGTNNTSKANENGAIITFKYQDNETADTELNVVKSYTPNGWLVGTTEYADGAVLVLTEDIEIEYNYTETLTNPSFPEPTRTDYMFDGWYDSTEWVNKVTEESEILDDINLYAHWIEDIRENENQCIIVKPDETTVLINKGETYNLGANETSKAAEDVSTVTFKYQDSESSDTTGKVTRTYTPAGWLVNDIEYADNSDYTCDSDMAVIRANYIEELISPVFPEPTREHYTFDGWYDSEENGLEVTNYTGDADINLYAYWTADEITVTLPDGTEETYYYGYSYTFGTNDISKANENGATITLKYQDNETVDTELNVVKSFTPNGWLVGNTEYADGVVLVLTENIEIEYNYTETLTNPSFPEPTRTDYMFDGWYTDTNYETKVTEESVITEDVTLYAHWIEDIRENENQCIIVKPDETTVLINKGETYNLGANDIARSSEDVATVTFKYQDGETADTTGKVVKSYTPAGWLVNDIEYADNLDYTCDSDMAVIRANYTEEVASPVFPEPTRDNYEFNGWFDAEEDGNLVESYTEDEDVNLYAHWTILAPTDFDVDANELTLLVGETHQIVPTFIPAGTEDTLVYSEYDNEVVSVVDGLITGIAPGTTTIKVELTSDNTIYKTISVTVLSNELLSGSLSVQTMPLGRIVIGEEPQTALEDFLSKINNPSEYIKVYDMNDELVEDTTEFAKTGMKIKLVINDEVIDEAYVVVRGDLDGDGYVDTSDGIIHQNIILEKPEYDGYKLDYRAYAADLDYDPNETEEIIIDATDGNILDNKILEKIDSLNH